MNKYLNVDDDFKLTPKQRLWAEHFIGDCYLNATEAYRRAYPNANDQTAKKNGSVNQRIPEIKRYITYLQDSVAETYHVTPEFLVKQYLDVLSKCKKEQHKQRWNSESQQLVDSAETYIDSKGANGAIQGIAKILGYDNLKIDMNADVSVNKQLDDIAKQLNLDKE